MCISVTLRRPEPKQNLIRARHLRRAMASRSAICSGNTATPECSQRLSCSAEERLAGRQQRQRRVPTAAAELAANRADAHSGAPADCANWRRLAQSNGQWHAGNHAQQPRQPATHAAWRRHSSCQPLCSDTATGSEKARRSAGNESVA